VLASEGIMMIDDRKVNVFFYGSYMNFDVLAKFGIGERHYEVVQLPGYELTIGSAANVVKSGLERVFGIIVQLTHVELQTLYGSDAQAQLGAQYLPEPVLVVTPTGDLVLSLCYITYDPVDGRPSATYIDSILKAGRKYHFPPSYIRHIESFK
jgi:hypothetical protein